MYIYSIEWMGVEKDPSFAGTETIAESVCSERQKRGRRGRRRIERKRLTFQLRLNLRKGRRRRVERPPDSYMWHLR